MIEVNITQEMKEEVWKKAKRKENKKLKNLRNSIRGGDGNILGWLGEYVANTIIQGEIVNTVNYDIVKDGLKYDVKTKQCTSEPKTSYACTVSAYNTRQECDNYVFVRIEKINRIWGRAWVLGWISKEDFLKKAHFLKKGERDGNTSFYARSDCYNLLISDLNQF